MERGLGVLFAVSLRWVLLIQEPNCVNCAGQGADQTYLRAASYFSAWHHFVSVLESPFLGETYKSSPGGQRTSLALWRKKEVEKKGKTPNICFSHFKMKSFWFLFTIGY